MSLPDSIVNAPSFHTSAGPPLVVIYLGQETTHKELVRACAESSFNLSSAWGKKKTQLSSSQDAFLGRVAGLE